MAGINMDALNVNGATKDIVVEGPNGVIGVTARCGGAVFPSDTIRTSEDLLRETNKSYRALQGAGRNLFDGGGPHPDPLPAVAGRGSTSDELMPPEQVQVDWLQVAGAVQPPQSALHAQLQLIGSAL